MVGALFVVVRLIDLPLDPLIGHGIDRTHTRFGRYRPWAFAGAALMFVGAWLAFLAPPGISPARALAGLLALYIGYSTLTLSQTAWGATLSDSYHERSRVFGWWQMATILGLVLMLLVPPTVAKLAADPDHAAGIHADGLSGDAAAAGDGAAAVAVRPRTGGQGRPVATACATCSGFLSAPLLGRLMLVDLLSGMALGTSGALLLFFVQATRAGFRPPTRACC